MKNQLMLFLTTTATAVQFHGVAQGYHEAYHAHSHNHKWLWFVMLLPTTATATISYRGTDTGFEVTCPLEDFLSSPCTPALAVPAEDCPVLQSCSQVYTPPSDNSIVVIPMTCSCLQLTNCPDTCTSDGDGSEVISSEPQTETGIDFQGPGTVTCDMSDFLARPCLPVKSDDCQDVAAEYRNNCDTNFVPPEDANAKTVEIPLPCACLSMYNCPLSCTLQPPIEEEEEGVDNDPEDTTASDEPTNEPVRTPAVGGESTENTDIDDLPEEPTTVEDQPEVDNSNVVDPANDESSTTDGDPIDTGLLSFRGPGVVVCPITAYTENPCCKSHVLMIYTAQVVLFDSKHSVRALRFHSPSPFFCD